MMVVDEIMQRFEERGAAEYFGENVSQLEHALEAANFACRAGASDSLIGAALLHDFGHLLHEKDERIADQGIDMCHEMLGETWLQRYFGREVTEPIRLHVAAKRYLCATDPGYLAKLSPASVQSLRLQGGPMTPTEVIQFEELPSYRDAISLRLFDDEAKIPGLPVPSLAHYRELLERLAQAPNLT